MKGLAWMGLGALWLANASAAQPIEFWRSSAYLEASDRERGKESFGASLALDGDVLMVGAPGEDPAAENVGAAYLFFRESNGTWGELAKLEPEDGSGADEYGSSVAVAGRSILIGSPGDDDLGSASGSVYVYEHRPGEGLIAMGKLLAQGGDSRQEFGRSMDAVGDRVVIGAPGHPEFPDITGAAHVFERNAEDVWVEVAIVEDSNPVSGGFFGISVAVDGDRLIVGANRARNTGVSGSVTVFERQPDGGWLEVGAVSGLEESFGSSVDLDGDLFVVGAPSELTFGAAYVYQRQVDGSWLEVEKLSLADGFEFDDFGASVVLGGEDLIVGAPGEDEVAIDSGAAYRYQLEASGRWELAEVWFHAEEESNEGLGEALALDGGRVVVGGPWITISGLAEGSIEIYEKVVVDPQLAFDGDCPGALTLTLEQVTPFGVFEAYGSASEGEFVLGGLDCAGTELGLENPIRVFTTSSDGNGRGQLVVDAPAGVCGLFFQVIDLTSCLVSPVAQVPD